MEPTSIVAPENEPPDSRRIRRELPYTGYLALVTTFEAAFFGFLYGLKRRGRSLPERLDARDLALVGVATYKISGMIARDRVTRPVRAPFTEYEQHDGRVKERPVHAGGKLRRAVGELLTCPICVGPWTAAALTYGLTLWPREARLFAGIFASVTVSDALHAWLPSR